MEKEILKALRAFQENVSVQEYEYDKGDEYISMQDYSDETPPNLYKEMEKEITPIQQLFEYMEQNQYFIGNDLLAKYKELLEKAVTPPNLDNLLELAREEGKRKHGRGLVPLFEYENQAFFDGAKFIIDKLKELGNVNRK